MTTAILCKKRFSYLRELANITNSDLMALSRAKEPDGFDKLTTSLSKYDIVFNWGIIYEHGINNSDAVRLASNKPGLRREWNENNLSVPKTYANLHHAQREGAIGPMIVRPTRHSAGKDFYYISSLENMYDIQYNNDLYLSEYIDKDREFRFHVMDNAILFAQEKYHKDGKKIVGNWNHTNGYLFRHMRWSEIEPKLAKLAVEAVKVSGLFFGAVDIMQESKNYYLLEINTAPRLEQYSIELYGNAINFYKEHGELTKSKVKQLFTYRGEDENS